jgi:hypothetical protein
MSGVLYRYQLDHDNNVWGWVAYRSLPERSLDGQLTFEVLDPDGVWTYLARLLGACYSQLSYDTSVIANQYDAQVCAPFFLPYLAQQYGLALSSTDTLQVQRNKVQNAVQTFKLKGTAEGVALRIQDFGYIGYAYEVFVNTGDVMGSFVNNSPGTAGNVSMKAIFASITQALTLYGMTGGTDILPAVGVVDFEFHTSPVQGDQLIMSDGTTTKTFYFTSSSSPGGTVPVVFGITQNDTMNALIAAVEANLNITGTNITKPMMAGPPIGNQPTSSTVWGTRTSADEGDILEFPHGYFSSLIPIYSMSSRVAVHMNNTDGTPLYYPDTPLGIAAAQALQQMIGSDLAFDVLPAHVDVMFFATDFNVVGPEMTEGVVVSETFSVTQV